VRVHFFAPAGGGLDGAEGAKELPVRVLQEIRGRAPIAAAGRRRKSARRMRDGAADAG
jgi:hypothetical protein